MSRIYYKIYHGNLAFSAIEEDALAEVIDKTYFALLDFVSGSKVKVGLELSGFSLEKIQELRPEWIRRFKELHGSGLIEFIGSGYMQIIAPLVPYEVNIKNQKIGKKIYQDILGITPDIAYINEQVFSKSLVDIYVDMGYKAIMMEWNNAYAIHPRWKKSYSFCPAIAQGIEKTIPVIWTDSIMFQQFQRTVHGEQNFGDYEYFLDGYIDINQKCISVYSSDLEIFNYRPGRFETEAVIKNDEWKNINKLCRELNRTGSFLLPSEILEHCSNDLINLDLTTAGSPIITKKQDKYSLSRWAACGVDANYINTLCYKYFYQIRESKDLDIWKMLLHYWGSDYRTHITQKKWIKAKRFLENKVKSTKVYNQNRQKADVVLNETGENLSFKKNGIEVKFLLNKGLALSSVYADGSKLPFGTIKHGELSHISHVADFFTGLSVIESANTKKVTDLTFVDSYDFWQTDRDVYKISTSVKMEDVAEEQKVWTLDLAKRSISLSISMSLKQFVSGSIRLGSFSMLTQGEDVYFECKNGGNLSEKYFLHDNDINQHAPKSLLQSSQGGLGITDGIIEFSSSKGKIVSIKIDQDKSCPFVMLQNHIDHDKQLVRLHFSVQELDDTLKINSEKLNREFVVSYSIEF